MDLQTAMRFTRYLRDWEGRIERSHGRPGLMSPLMSLIAGDTVI
jgi:hypothetical protein